NHFKLQAWIECYAFSCCHVLLLRWCIFHLLRCPDKLDHSKQLLRTKFRLGKDGTRKSQAGQIRLFRTDPCAEDSPTIVARLYNEKQGTPRQLSRAHTGLFQLYGQKLRQEIQEGVTVVIESLREIFILDPIPSHMRAYFPLSERLDSDGRNIAGVLAALPEEKGAEIEGVLAKYASQLPERDIRRVYAATVGPFKSDAMLYCEERWLDNDEVHLIDARGMSDGTLRFLAILTALLTRPRGSLLVIEEVDNGLHPSRATLLLAMLTDVGTLRGVDVLVTTHNPALLDAMGTAMVPFITVAHRDPSAGCSLLTLLEDIDQLPKLLAQGPVGMLSSRGLIETAVTGRARPIQPPTITQQELDFSTDGDATVAVLPPNGAVA
ncbi:AAA family ATPase, partial [Massilia sp. DWR3-1-1]|uniref:AAA family ATPase n=1 Tax=Massilia sp. DWR3-1-1 TaxID=2804559 RepID=UPI003CF07B21